MFLIWKKESIYYLVPHLIMFLILPVGVSQTDIDWMDTFRALAVDYKLVGAPLVKLCEHNAEVCFEVKLFSPSCCWLLCTILWGYFFFTCTGRKNSEVRLLRSIVAKPIPPPPPDRKFQPGIRVTVEKTVRMRGRRTSSMKHKSIPAWTENVVFLWGFGRLPSTMYVVKNVVRTQPEDKNI